MRLTTAGGCASISAQGARLHRAFLRRYRCRPICQRQRRRRVRAAFSRSERETVGTPREELPRRTLHQPRTERQPAVCGAPSRLRRGPRVTAAGASRFPGRAAERPPFGRQHRWHHGSGSIRPEQTGRLLPDFCILRRKQYGENTSAGPVPGHPPPTALPSPCAAGCVPYGIPKTSASSA